MSDPVEPPPNDAVEHVDLAAVVDPATVPLPSDVATAGAKLAGIFGWLADFEFAGYSPLYQHLARRIADTPWITGFITQHNRSSFAPMLFFGCVRDLTLVEPDLPLSQRYAEIIDGADPLAPDPWPLFHEVVLDHRAELAHALESRSIQTNEVGRSAALLPAFAAVHRRFERPLALIEVGCSAGLNLLFDRFHIAYHRAGPDGSATTVAESGPADSPVQLVCELRGDLGPVVPDAPPPVVSRLGIDLNPVDVTDRDATRWLDACLWPDVPHRLERFRAAVELARLEPPTIRAGNAVDLVADAIRAVPTDAVACLDSTWVLAYFSDDERAELRRLLDELGADRSIAYVTAEYRDNGAAWLPPPPRDSVSTDHRAPTLLGLGLWDHGRTEHRALAWMPPHGQWLDWMDATTSA